VERAAETRSDGDKERGRIAGRAGIVGLGTLASRLLGLLRDQVIAAVFSRTVTDAFFVAFLIPNVLRQLLAEGAVQNAVLPVLSEVREREGDAAARRFFRAVRGLSLTLLVIVTALGVAFARELVALFAAGYRQEPGQFELTVQLTRWVFPYILFMGTAALGIAALNTYHRFVVSSFAPGLLNVAFVVVSLVLPSFLGARGYEPGLALAIAALAGGVLQVVAQWPSLRRIGFLDPPSFEFGHPGVRSVLSRMAPMLFGIGVYYVDVVLARRFLSELGTGAQSYFAWALRLCDFPQGIFVMALSTAALPSLSRFSARGDYAELGRTFAFGMKLALFVAVPATALVVALAEPIVMLLFQRGAFDAESTRETGRALVAQGLGIWAVAGVRQLLSVYYAVGNTRAPVIVAALDLCVFVALALLLRGPFGHVGIGYAVTGAAIAQFAMLWWGLGRHLPSRHFADVAGSALRVLGASVVGAMLALLSIRALGLGPDSSPALRLLPGVVGSLVFAVAFLVAAALFKSPELRSFRNLLQKKLRRRTG
jgi:putative peptidoglycan lipid II flippase